MDQKYQARKETIDNGFNRGVEGARAQAQWEPTPAKRELDEARRLEAERERFEAMVKGRPDPRGEAKQDALLQNRGKRLYEDIP